MSSTLTSESTAVGRAHEQARGVFVVRSAASKLSR